MGTLVHTDPSDPACNALTGTADGPTGTAAVLVGVATADDAAGLLLTDDTADFIAAGVLPGDVVTNVANGSTGVVDVVAATQLTLAAPLTGGTAQTFSIGDAYDVASTSILTDSTADFEAAGVQVGDVVTNTTDGSTGVVATVDYPTKLTLDAPLAGGTDDTFANGDLYDIGSPTILTDAGADFLAAGVLPGDVVTNTTDGSTGVVATVDSPTQLTLEAPLAGGDDDSFANGDRYEFGGFEALGADDYLVHIDLAHKVDAKLKPIYKVTREEDINIGNGDSFVPQVPPPACAGALHKVDVAGMAPDAAGATVNQTFVDIGGSPYEGQMRPLCDTKLVPLQNGKSVVPMFNVFTDVPLPGRFFAYNVDDLAFSADPKSLLFGEKTGLPFNPVGIYDFANRLITTVETDYNGVFDVLLPSTNRINCPTPSGVCANLYRFVGNDPGMPGQPEPQLQPAVSHDRCRVRILARHHRAGGHRTDPGRRDRPAARPPVVRVRLVPGQRPDRDSGDAGAVLGVPALGPAPEQRQCVIHDHRASVRRHPGRRPGHVGRRPAGHRVVVRHGDRRQRDVQHGVRSASAQDHGSERSEHDQRPDLPCRPRRHQQQQLQPASLRGGSRPDLRPG